MNTEQNKSNNSMKNLGSRGGEPKSDKLNNATRVETPPCIPRSRT